MLFMPFNIIGIWFRGFMGLIEHHDRFDRLVAEFAASCHTAIMVK
jgi:hypothetical protein